MTTISYSILIGLVVLLCVYILQQPNPGKALLRLIAGFIFEAVIQIALPLLLALFLIWLAIKGCFGVQHQ